MDLRVPDPSAHSTRNKEKCTVLQLRKKIDVLLDYAVKGEKLCEKWPQ